MLSKLIKEKELLQKIKWLLYSLDHAQACNEFAWSIAATLRLGKTRPFEEKSQRWRPVGNSVLDLTDPRFKSQTFRTQVAHITA